MIEKIKAFADSVKGVLLWIVTPLLILAGVLYELLSKNKELETELKAKDGESKLKELQGEQTQVDKQAHQSTDDYQSLRDAYLRDHKDE